MQPPSTTTVPPRRGPLAPVSIAPMMDRTDRHYRRMMRFITKRTLLYTEMVVARAIQHGDRDRLLGFDPAEGPLALQLGGDDPALLAECARIAEDRGYDEVNLNIGCPSNRVQAGNFGVCLMGEPDTVARCVEAMRAAVSIPVTVKHRIGFDDRDGYEDMLDFVDRVTQAGCRRFTVHARKAWLQGLSPKENRNVPPLRYDEVWRLKRERPDLDIEINGGIKTLDAIDEHLGHVDAVMLGRAAWDHPLLFTEADARFFGEAPSELDVDVLLDGMIEHAERYLAGDPRRKLSAVVKPMLNLWAGQPGARAWRRALTQGLQQPGATPSLIRDAWQTRQLRAAG